MYYTKKVLVIVAHSDDETIGCGGYIKKLSNSNHEVKAISFTDGISSRGRSISKKKERIKNSVKASKVLGFQWLKRFNFPDNALDTIPLIKIIKKIETIKKKFNPELLITHNFNDLNIDHRIIAEAALTAFRPEPNSKLKKFITFEIPSSTDFRNLRKKNFCPNFYIDINETIDFKLKALLCYESEIKKYPHSRSRKAIKNLAKLRGNQVGLKFAESFEIIRHVEK